MCDIGGRRTGIRAAPPPGNAPVAVRHRGRRHLVPSAERASPSRPTTGHEGDRTVAAMPRLASFATTGLLLGAILASGAVARPAPVAVKGLTASPAAITAGNSVAA